VVVLTGGSAFVTEAWRDAVAAVVMAWYPGMEGGTALGEVLAGVVDPSGHLPFAVPVDEGDLPEFVVETDHAVYGLLHGQWWLDRNGSLVRYPFGHGLSYTTFEPVSVDVRRADGGPVAEVTWRNDGDRRGTDVAQVYASLPDSIVERPRRRLVGFARITLEPRSSGTVSVPLDLAQLRVRRAGTWEWEAGRIELEAARWSGDPHAARWTGVSSNGSLLDGPHPAPEA
jgi:beta-glucosidase